MTKVSSGSTSKALIQAALFAGATLVLALLTVKFGDSEAKRRVFGIVSGALLMFYANSLPKTLKPLARLRCSPVAEQALRRFAGWGMTLGGAAFSLAWLVAPVEIADEISAISLLVAVSIVVTRIAWAYFRGART